jgi:hypothetical protein
MQPDQEAIKPIAAVERASRIARSAAPATVR